MVQEKNNLPQGVLEGILKNINVPWIVIEANLTEKSQKEQHQLIDYMEKQMIKLGYNINREFQNGKKAGLYHLHFVNIKGRN